MQKRVGTLSFLALALVVYLIWNDPNGMGNIVQGFGEAVGGFLGDLWSRLGEFFSSLAS